MPPRPHPKSAKPDTLATTPKGERTTQTPPSDAHAEGLNILDNTIGQVESLPPNEQARLQRDILDKIGGRENISFTKADLIKIIFNLDSFRVDQQQFAMALIGTPFFEPKLMAENLDRFQQVDYIQIATQLITKKHGDILAANLEKFKGLRQEKVAAALILAGQGEVLAKYLEKFSRLSHAKVASMLIQKGYGSALAEHFKKFNQIDRLKHSNIALALILAGNGNDLALHFENFSGLRAGDHPKLALAIAESTANQRSTVFLNTFVNNLYKFKGANHDAIANILINNGHAWVVKKHREKFAGLSPAINARLDRL